MGGVDKQKLRQKVNERLAQKEGEVNTRLERREIAGSEVHWLHVCTGSEFFKDSKRRISFTKFHADKEK